MSAIASWNGCAFFCYTLYVNYDLGEVKTV
jgi:hypothetical protein